MPKKEKENLPPSSQFHPKLLPCGRPMTLPAASIDDQLERYKKKLKAYLAGQGLKYSEQRWNIARLILERQGHFSAQDLVREVLLSHPDIGAATVYRNLKLLCEAKILRETLIDSDGRAIYESFDDEHHDHIVCLDCREIFEFHDSEIETQQDQIMRRLSFEPVRHRHVMYAHCSFRRGAN